MTHNESNNNTVFTKNMFFFNKIMFLIKKIMLFYQKPWFHKKKCVSNKNDFSTETCFHNFFFFFHASIRIGQKSLSCSCSCSCSCSSCPHFLWPLDSSCLMSYFWPISRLHTFSPWPFNVSCGPILDSFTDQQEVMKIVLILCRFCVLLSWLMASWQDSFFSWVGNDARSELGL